MSQAVDPAGSAGTSPAPVESVHVGSATIDRFSVGRHSSNCYIVHTREKDAVVIDPGADSEVLTARISGLGLQIRALVLTHAHWDHVGAAQELSTSFDAPVFVHKADVTLLRQAPFWALRMDGQGFRSPERLEVWEDVASIEIGSGHRLHMQGAPGHTPGSAKLRLDSAVFTGDTLLRRRIGRTDMPGGSRAALEESLRDLLVELATAVWVCPGHGRFWPAAEAVEWLTARPGGLGESESYEQP